VPGLSQRIQWDGTNNCARMLAGLTISSSGWPRLTDSKALARTLTTLPGYGATTTQ